MSGARVAVVGAGGHAKVVADALRLSHQQLVVCLDDRSTTETTFEGVPRICPVSAHAAVPFDWAIIAIGDNRVRWRIYEQLREQGVAFGVVIHPSAVVATSALIADDVFIAARAAINPYVSIGANTIINTSAVIDHECLLGEHCHVAPGAVLGGGVTVGPGTLIGIGATVIPGVRVGANVIIGAGACVINDVPEGATVVGIPAKELPTVR